MQRGAAISVNAQRSRANSEDAEACRDMLFFGNLLAELMFSEPVTLFLLYHATCCYTLTPSSSADTETTRKSAIIPPYQHGNPQHLIDLGHLPLQTFHHPNLDHPREHNRGAGAVSKMSTRRGCKQSGTRRGHVGASRQDELLVTEPIVRSW